MPPPACLMRSADDDAARGADNACEVDRRGTKAVAECAPSNVIKTARQFFIFDIDSYPMIEENNKRERD